MGFLVIDWLILLYNDIVDSIGNVGNKHSSAFKVGRGALFCVLWSFIIVISFLILGLGWLFSIKSGLIQDAIVVSIILLVQFFKWISEKVWK